jgi:DNA-binding NarL/FixJ family response regulator
MTFHAKSKDEDGSLALLQQIRNRVIKPKSLDLSQRRLLVSMLINEGQSSAEIAQLLDVSDRTIERDRQVYRFS